MSNIYLKEHLTELIFAGVVISFAFGSVFFGVPNDTAWIIGICTTLITINTVIIKHNQKEVINNSSIEISNILTSLSGDSYEYASTLVKNTIDELHNIQKGKVLIDEASYYIQVNDIMKNSKPNSNIFAIYNMDPVLWSKNDRQIRYFNANIEALKSGVKIYRIFILDKNKIKLKESYEAYKNIKEQIKLKNLKVYIVWLDSLSGNTQNEDWVYFRKDNKLYQSFTNDNIHAQLYLSKEIIDKKMNNFKKLKTLALEDENRNVFFGIE